ncbi:MAG: DHH family phosphoesterase [Bacteroidia bacterium]
MNRLLRGVLSHWQLYEPDTDIQFDASVPLPIAQALHRRGVKTASDLEAFLYPDAYPFSEINALPDAEQALELLHYAVQRQKKIFIVGDYDVDGTTAATLLYTFLEALGYTSNNVKVHLPNRLSEGYGISAYAVQRAIEFGAELFIAVDCGTKDIASLERLKAAGMRIIVLDHHRVDSSTTFPPADAFVNPQRPDSHYHNRYLSAGALTYRLLAAYQKRYGQPEDWEGVDLGAISLLADIMPLVGENRALVQLGLRRLRSSLRPGIAKLMEIARLTPEHLTYSRSIVFQLVPRLNASGRLRDARYTFYLLSASAYSDKVREVAEYLNSLNQYRQTLQESAYQEALKQLEARYPGIMTGEIPPPSALVVVGKNWHKGVIGLVASKLVERFYRPTVVFIAAEDRLIGSARSPAEVPLYEVLNTYCRPYMERFGGHDRAAGLTIRAENLESFTREFQAGCATYEPLVPLDFIDSEISPEMLADTDFVSWCDRFEPTGPQNDAPRFLLRGLRYCDGVEGNKLCFATSTARLYEAYPEGVHLERLKTYLNQHKGNSLSIVFTPRLSSANKVYLRLRDVLIDND